MPTTDFDATIHYRDHAYQGRIICTHDVAKCRDAHEALCTVTRMRVLLDDRRAFLTALADALEGEEDGTGYTADMDIAVAGDIIGWALDVELRGGRPYVDWSGEVDPLSAEGYGLSSAVSAIYEGATL